MREIKWNKNALRQFQAALTFIGKDSLGNAYKVKQALLEKIEALSRNAELYTPDKYKNDNTGNYRAFELHRYRVSYLVKSNEVIIARIRHTSQEPKMY